MRLNIKIDYTTAHGNITQAGEFPLRGRKPEQVAYEWWRKIKWDTYKGELRRVTIKGDQDITEAVKALENAPLPPDNLPF